MAQGQVQSVDRAARVLLAFEELDEPRTVGELATELGVHKSTASRLVATLVRHDLLEPSHSADGLQLGPALRRLARRAANRSDLAELAQPAVDALAASTGETVTLAVAAGQTVATVAQGASRHRIGASTWLGLRAPLHATSDGKVLLAAGVAVLGAGPLKSCTPATLVDLDALDRELALVRARGWAGSVGEFEVGLNGVSVPVHGARGRVRAALCVSGPEYRVPADAFEELAAACRDAAHRVEEQLVRGWLSGSEIEERP